MLSLAVLLLACDKSGDAPAANTKAPEQAADAKPESKVVSKVVSKDAPTPTPPAIAAAVLGKAEVGKPAPDFTLVDLAGQDTTLSSVRGKTVVVEWFDPNCPFVNNAHAEGSLKTMAKDETAAGVVWLAIDSGGPGKQGHGVEANALGVKTFALDHAVLLDESGAIGRAYGAERTPQVYLIDDTGTLVYRGAVDNAPFGEVDGGGASVNDLAKALAELRAGKPITTSESAPYGCTVKYRS